MCFFVFPPITKSQNSYPSEENPVASSLLFLNKMNLFSLLLPTYWYMYLHMFLAITASALGNNADHSALLKFKEPISKDPYGVLNSWNSSIHLCTWRGITCSPMHHRVTELNLHGYGLQGTISPQIGNLSFLTILNLRDNSFYGRIPQELGRLLQLQTLHLTNNSLDGEFPTSLTNCSELKVLGLSGNNLIGKIPVGIGSLRKLQVFGVWRNKLTGKIPASIGNLSSLIVLNAGENSLDGEFPTNLTSCSKLKVLGLDGNNLIGKIPVEIGSLQKLQVLGIGRNKLTGKIPVEIGSLRKLQLLIVWRNKLTGIIPASIGNLSSLTLLHVADNNLEGNIPQEIGRLRNLTHIEVHVNKLHGTFPSYLYNISSLIEISASDNHFNGSLPPNIFHTLPNLQFFEIGANQISGPIPISITNASVLQYLEISENNFVGQVPGLGKLHDIWRIHLEENNLGGKSTKDLDFLKPLANCSKLSVLSIAHNNFGGCLPNFIGSLSTQLSRLYLAGNEISGRIPTELGNLNSLILLTMNSNHFDGIIPAAFGKFQMMQLLTLDGNKLSRDIPAFIGNLSQLYYLDLSQNMLEGNIPPSIGNCQKLQFLNLSRNHLRGDIPSEVFSIVSLTNMLDLSQNFLSGSLPHEVGRLKNIDWLDVSGNHLSGDIPGTIGECMSLEYLYLQANSFHGIIPSSLTLLKGLRKLDLSRNHLFGKIPEGLQNISVLEYLNISFNMFDGKVPTEGVFRNSSAFAMAGNINLCGGISELHLPRCFEKGTKLGNHHNLRKLIAVIVCVISFLLILAFSLTIYWMRKRNKKPSSDSPIIDQLAKVSYQNLHNETDGFSARNLIGSGNFGSVYKGTLESQGKIVAVKVLNLQKKGAHKSFIAECNALRNIRHRNLVKILTCCSTTDYKGQEFKALVFEFMTNGSLESWLHPAIQIADQRRPLDLEQRLNIITDVASALHYLHYECEQAIIHCDLKPSNILLDDCFAAHVSDFGLAILLSSVGVFPKQTSTIAIKGTTGYVPPEYGMGSEASIEGDMYSFGILILEMLTRRRPTDEMFEEGQSLHNYVKISIPNQLLQIVDPTILPKELERAYDSENLTLMHPNVKKCLLSLFRIALACSVESPKERMGMLDIMRELNLIKSFFPSGEINGG